MIGASSKWCANARVDGGGSDDELQILAAREQALQVTEEKVDVERALGLHRE